MVKVYETKIFEFNTYRFFLIFIFINDIELLSTILNCSMMQEQKTGIEPRH